MKPKIFQIRCNKCIEKEIKIINPKKATPSGNILPKILMTANTLEELFV